MSSPTSGRYPPSTWDGAYAIPLSREAWIKQRPTIQNLYINKKMKLNEVREYMSKNHNFEASEKQFKDKFVQWGMRKNIRKEDFEWMIRMHFKYAEQNRHATFQFHGEEVKWNKLSRFMRRYPESRQHLRSTHQQVDMDHAPNGIEISIDPPRNNKNTLRLEKAPFPSSEHPYRTQTPHDSITTYKRQPIHIKCQRKPEGFRPVHQLQSEQAPELIRDDSTDYSSGSDSPITSFDCMKKEIADSSMDMGIRPDQTAPQLAPPLVPQPTPFCHNFTPVWVDTYPAPYSTPYSAPYSAPYFFRKFGEVDQRPVFYEQGPALP